MSVQVSFPLYIFTVKGVKFGISNLCREYRFVVLADNSTRLIPEQCETEEEFYHCRAAC